mgnify:FL=1
MKRILTSLICMALALSAWSAKSDVYKLASPDGATIVSVNAGGKTLTYSVQRNGQEVLGTSAMSMTLRTTRKNKINEFQVGGTVKKAVTSSVNRQIDAPFYKFSTLQEKYNQLDLTLNDGFGILFRAYDHGVAFRFYATSLQKDDIVLDELTEYNFGKDYEAFIPYGNGKESNPYQLSFESKYTRAPISTFRDDWPAFSPLLVCLDGGMKVAITESDLEAYPGMFLRKNLQKANSLVGAHANIPSKTQKDSWHQQEMAIEYSDIMAIIRKDSSKKAPRNFPWRVLAITDNDAQLAETPLVYLLGEENRIGDTSWIKPGKIAWDYWNNWALEGVDFESGLNNETWKYYIDFASKNGIEYVIFDEGWYQERAGDIMAITPGLDVEELVKYANERNVGIILWAISYTLDKDLEGACKYFSEMGVKGFKVDFIDRDDQEAVELNYRVAEMMAKYHLLLDLHGMYKPAGFNRTFPHTLNYEGIWGLENMKWSTEDIIEYDVTFPFIRMLAGPVDYTQGAMRSVGNTRRGFAPSFSYPASQGTRSHQIGMYVVLDSPLAMLADSPTAYEKEPETTQFIASIPTVWDETRILEGEVGKFIVTARRSGDKWYIGGLTGWTPKDVSLDLGFTGCKKATIYKDGINVNKIPIDHKIETVPVTSEPLSVRMAPGGGFAIILE